MIPTVTKWCREEIPVSVAILDIPLDEVADTDHADGMADAEVDRVALAYVDLAYNRGDRWICRIDLATGVIEGWAEHVGIAASILTKPRDDCKVTLLNAAGAIVTTRDDCVPRFLSYYGDNDYFLLDVDATGRLRWWEKRRIDLDLSDFEIGRPKEDR